MVVAAVSIYTPSILLPYVQLIFTSFFESSRSYFKNYWKDFLSVGGFILSGSEDHVESC